MTDAQTPTICIGTKFRFKNLPGDYKVTGFYAHHVHVQAVDTKNKDSYISLSIREFEEMLGGVLTNGNEN